MGEINIIFKGVIPGSRICILEDYVEEVLFNQEATRSNFVVTLRKDSCCVPLIIRVRLARADFYAIPIEKRMLAREEDIELNIKQEKDIV